MNKIRRSLLIILTVMSVLLCAVTVTGCKNPSITQSEKVLVIGTTAKISSLNRLNASSGSQAGYNYDVLTGTVSQMALVSIDEKGEFVPLLADYTSSEDYSKWTFVIKNQMQWHDGVSVTAEDISFTLINQFGSTGEDKTISDIKIISPMELTVILPTPNPRFLRGLTTVRILPKHRLEGKTAENLRDEDSVVGCGPFKFSRFDNSANVLEFVKFDGYPYADKISFDKVIFKTFNSDDVMDLALKSGDIDMEYKYANGVTKNRLTDLLSNGNISSTSYADATNHMNLIFNNGAVTDVRIRQAIEYAIDYDKIINIFGTSYAYKAKKNFISPPNLGYIDSYDELKFDLSKAKSLLNSAGYGSSNKYNFELTVRTDGEYAEIAKVLKTMLEKTDAINVSIKAYEAKTFSAIVQKKSHQACLMRFTAFGMGNKGGLGSMYMETGGNLPTGNISDPIFADILDKLNKATTLEGYRLSAKEYQDYFATNTPAISLYNDNFAQAYSNKLTGFTIDGTFGILNLNTWLTLKKGA